MTQRVIAVVGASQCDPQEYEAALELGRLLAEREAIVVCGGRGGVMEGVCRGASEGGGFTVGILPGTQSSEGNAYLSLALPTGMGHARNALVVQAGSAVIAIGGGSGTLSEIALALSYGRTVIGIGTWRGADAKGRKLPLLMAENPQHAVEIAWREGP